MARNTLHNRELLGEYIVGRNLPTIWCPGCGIGTVVGSLMRSIHDLGIPREELMMSVGIGCSGFASRYVNFDAVHTTHGRAIAVATGVKLAKPNLRVITLTGDGDCLAIGGNHFIHAARRNTDMTVILFNNSIYGMTGGQYSPTTPKGSRSSTSPYGMVEGTFDACELARVSGATFVARSTTYHVRQLEKLISEAIEHPGFAVVEVLTQCPSQFGRMNKRGTASDMMLEFKKRCVRVDTKGETDSLKTDDDRIAIGLLYKDSERPEYTAEYAKVREEAKRRVMSG